MSNFIQSSFTRPIVYIFNFWRLHHEKKPYGIRLILHSILSIASKKADISIRDATTRVPMGLTDRRKTAKNLADSCKN